MAAHNGIVPAVRNVVGQEPPPWPVEGWCDPHSGLRYRRECLGSVGGGILIVSDLARSSGIDLLFRRKYGNPSKPKLHGEVSGELRRWLVICWPAFMHKGSKVVIERQGDLYFLCRMPLGVYGSEQTPEGNSVLHRYHPVVRRPRAALAVGLASSSPG